MVGRAAPSRRAFLTTAARASAAAALAGMGAGCATCPRVTPTVEAGVARVPVAALEAGPGVLVDHPGEALPLYLHRHGPDRFTAVLARCTHRGCEVEPMPERMVCPCHGSAFALDGALLEGPAQAPLVAYPASRRGDHVHIDLTRGEPSA